MDDKALVPFSDMKEMATVLGKSGMFGKTPEQLLALMLIAQSEGIHPARAAQEYDVIQGRPALKGVSALARFQDAGGRVDWKERTDDKCEAVFSHPQSGSVTIAWDMAKAARMGLATKDNWKKQPGIMLQWRVVAEGVRVCYPACLNRMYLVEEVQDFDPVRNVTLDSDVAALSDPRGANGEYTKPTDPGELATRGDGTASRMIQLRTEFYSIINASAFTAAERKDANAEAHPGGRDLVASEADETLLQGLIDKYKALLRERSGDAELDDGFRLALDKVD